jgi:molecular chaperone Hsp33
MSEPAAGGETLDTGAPPDDDIVIAFQTLQSGVVGRLIRLGPAVDQVLASHAYPEPVARILGEALALTAMLGSQLKFDGRFILQTNTDGPLRLLVVNYQTSGSFRGYAGFNAEAIAALLADGRVPSDTTILGNGHLALTIDPGGDMERYQGIVEIDGTSLSEAAQEYFRRSEQLASFIKLSVARHFAGGAWRWRAGGIIVQHLTAEGGHEIPERDDGTTSGWEPSEADDDWRRVEMLARTVEDHELIDPLLSPQRLLYRLFHEEGVRASKGLAVAAKCGCSREHVGGFIRGFGKDELADLRDPDGGVTVTCEFCATQYHFSSADLD